jgi:hypothetical protein
MRLTGKMSTGEKNIKNWRSKHGNLLIFKIYESCEVKKTFVKMNFMVKTNRNMLMK